MNDQQSPRDIADYIHDLSGQMSDMASDAELHLLAYLLDMVQIEAANVLERTGLDDLPDDDPDDAPPRGG